MVENDNTEIDELVSGFDFLTNLTIFAFIKGMNSKGAWLAQWGECACNS